MRSSFDPCPVTGPRLAPGPKEVHGAVRAYELMVIFDGSLEDEAVQTHLKEVQAQVGQAGQLVRTDYWGRRRFAYEIAHKTEGFYAVLEIETEGGALDGVERSLRLADHVVRHKLIRLPDGEAQRRGLLGASAPAAG